MMDDNNNDHMNINISNEMIMKLDYHGEKFMILYNDYQRSLSFNDFLIGLYEKKKKPISTPTAVTVTSQSTSTTTVNVNHIRLYFNDSEGDNIALDSHEDIVLAFRLTLTLPLRVFLYILDDENKNDDGIVVVHKNENENENENEKEDNSKLIKVKAEAKVDQLSSSCNVTDNKNTDDDFEVIHYGNIKENENENEKNDDVAIVVEAKEKSSSSSFSSSSSSSTDDDDDNDFQVVKKVKDQKQKKQMMKKMNTNAIHPIQNFIQASFHLNGITSMTVNDVHNILLIAQLPKRRLLKVRAVDITRIEQDSNETNTNDGMKIMKDIYKQFLILDNGNAAKSKIQFYEFRILLRSLNVWSPRFVKLNIISEDVRVMLSSDKYHKLFSRSSVTDVVDVKGDIDVNAKDVKDVNVNVVDDITEKPKKMVKKLVKKAQKLVKKKAKKELKKMSKKEESENSSSSSSSSSSENSSSENSLSENSSSENSSSSSDNNGNNGNGNADNKKKKTKKQMMKKIKKPYAICQKELKKINNIDVSKKALKFFNNNFANLPNHRLVQIKKVDMEKFDGIYKNEMMENGPGIQVFKDIHSQMVNMALIKKKKDDILMDMYTFRKVCRSLKIWPGRFVRNGLINSEMPYAVNFKTHDEKKIMKKVNENEMAMKLCQERLLTLNGITVDVQQLKIFNRLAELGSKRLCQVTKLSEEELKESSSGKMDPIVLSVLQDIHNFMIMSAASDCNNSLVSDETDFMSFETFMNICTSLGNRMHMRLIKNAFKNDNKGIVKDSNAEEYKKFNQLKLRQAKKAMKNNNSKEEEEEENEKAIDFCIERLLELNGIVLTHAQLKNLVEVLQIRGRLRKVKNIHMSNLHGRFEGNGKGGRVLNKAYEKLLSLSTPENKMSKLAFKATLASLSVYPKQLLKRGFVVDTLATSEFELQKFEKEIEKLVIGFSHSLMNVVSKVVLGEATTKSQEKNKKKEEKKNDAMALCISKSFFLNDLKITRSQLEVFNSVAKFSDDMLRAVKKVQKVDEKKFEDVYKLYMSTDNGKNEVMNRKTVAMLSKSLGLRGN